jgi:ABC-2 type transport system ATP-binding protein
MPAKTATDISHVVKEFGSHRAVDDVSFNVDAGEVFGLLGPNGAGKTTTIRILTTLIPPTSGHMFVDGFDVATDDSSVRRRIGYVPQTVSADGALTGYENLLIFAKLLRFSREERDRRITQALHDSQFGGSDASLEDVFTAVTGDRLESGGNYRELRQLDGRTRRFA